MTDHSELVKKLRDLHRDPRPASAVWLFDNQVALYDAAAAIEELQAEVQELKRVNLEIFEDLPKMGKWIVKGANRIDCSVCGHSVCFAFGLSEGSFDSYKYCPECGAKMEVQE